jgi:hypothetical protein
MRILITISILILAMPAVAQEIDLGLGGDVGGLLNLPAPAPTTPRGAPPRGAAPARGAPAPRGAANTPPVDRLARLRELLVAANIPFSPEQEAALNNVMNSEIATMRRTLQARVLELQKAKGGVPPGAPPTTNLPSMEEITPLIIRLNDELLGKMSEAPALTAEQKTFMKKLYRDQVKSRGGLDNIRLSLADAGAPLSEEQIRQIQPLFEEPKPDLAKVLQILTQAQRKALLAAGK